jgi:hypothetical protein
MPASGIFLLAGVIGHSALHWISCTLHGCNPGVSLPVPSLRHAISGKIPVEGFGLILRAGDQNWVAHPPLQMRNFNSSGEAMLFPYEIPLTCR